MKYGRYEIVREVGSGSMGVVYEARDPQIDRKLAIKVLRPERLSNESLVKRFLKEAKIIGRLMHPNIVTVFDVGEDGETIYIAMEFLEGRPLSDMLKSGPLGPGAVAELGVQIAETLAYAHQQGVIHRDIKPSNICITPDNRVKITDFGIARIEDTSATLQTQTGDIMGTPAYMSPEQIQGNPIDGRTDIFSLGVVLYEMIVGKRPFGGEGSTMMRMFNDIIRNTPPEPHVLVPTIPRGFSRVILKALEKDPAQRFQSGAELADALKAVLAAPEPSQPPKDRKEKPSYLIAAAIATAVVLAGGSYWVLRQTGSAPPPLNPQAEVSSPRKEVPAQSAPVAMPEPPAAAITSTAPPAAPPIPEPRPMETPKPHPTTPKPASNAPTSTAEPHSTAPVQSRPVAAKPKPAAANVALTLKSTPPGAGIYLDRKYRGTTPMTLMVSSGEHRLRLSLTGYEEVDKPVVVGETMEYPLVFTLKSSNP